MGEAGGLGQVAGFMRPILRVMILNFDKIKKGIRRANKVLNGF